MDQQPLFPNQNITNPTQPVTTNIDEKTLIDLTNSNNSKKLKELLKTSTHISLINIKDSSLYSLLHIACLNGQFQIVEFFLNYTKKQNCPPADLKNWVNSKNLQGFTPLHYASLSGQIELIKLLEQNGADIFAKNNKGLNVVHMAAQGDHPICIAYFLTKGFNLQTKDNNGNTPLHWAAYFGKESALYYLLSDSNSLDEKEQELGCTPLHSAVNSENPKVVRKLLLKGADPHIRNNEGKLPVDLAIENQDENVTRLFNKENRLIECLHVRPPLKKMNGRPLLFFALSLIGTLMIFNVMFLFPFIASYAMLTYFITLMVLVGLSFILTWLVNSGAPKSKEKDVFKLLTTYDKKDICFECSLLKIKRSKHCDYCNKCVPVHDHHCPWVNNCIGAKNYRYYLAFIFLTPIALLSVTALSILSVSDQGPTALNYYHFYIHDLGTLVSLKEITSVLDFLMTILFVLPLFGLNYLHWGNLYHGKTTSERFSKNKQEGKSFNSGDDEYRPLI